MLSITVQAGAAINIGNVAAVRVDHKYGRRVKLTIATALSPITVIPTGIIPDHLITGLPPRHEDLRDAVAG